MTIKFPMDQYTMEYNRLWAGKLVEVHPRLEHYMPHGIRLLDETGRWCDMTSEGCLALKTPFLIVSVSGDGLPSPSLRTTIIMPNGVQRNVLMHIHSFGDLEVIR